jgi:uncharacterized OB-fold protein
MADRIPGFAGVPDTNPEMAGFWQATSEGRFLVRGCDSCGRTHWYPRARCPHCFSDRTAWREATGRGTIYSYSHVVRAEMPYVMAYVTLADGPTMMTNIVDCDPAAVRIGQAVHVVLKPSQDGPPVPMFTPD